MFEHRSRMFDRDTREFFSDTNCSMIIDPIKKQEFQESVEYIHTYIRIYTRGEKRILFNNYSGDRSIRIVWFSLSGNEAIFPYRETAFTSVDRIKRTMMVREMRIFVNYRLDRWKFVANYY